MLKKRFLLFISLLVLTACSSMVWHEGSMIQYSNVQAVSQNQFKIEVLGGWDHDQASLERAVLVKAKKECKGEAEIISSEMGTYYSSTTGGGVNLSGNPPKIISTVKCVINGS